MIKITALVKVMPEQEKTKIQRPHFPVVKNKVKRIPISLEDMENFWGKFMKIYHEEVKEIDRKLGRYPY